MRFVILLTIFFMTHLQAIELMLYYSPSCPYSQKVLRYLHQIHKTVPMKDVSHDKQAKEELIRVGGRKQVPCLFIDGKPLYESNDIIQWLSAHQEELKNE